MGAPEPVPSSRFNLPNVITVIRIAVCPVLFWLAMSTNTTARFAAFALFTAAGLSDILDGYLFTHNATLRPHEVQWHPPTIIIHPGD